MGGRPVRFGRSQRFRLRMPGAPPLPSTSEGTKGAGHRKRFGPTGAPGKRPPGAGAEAPLLSSGMDSPDRIGTSPGCADGLFHPKSRSGSFYRHTTGRPENRWSRSRERPNAPIRPKCPAGWAFLPNRWRRTRTWAESWHICGKTIRRTRPWFRCARAPFGTALSGVLAGVRSRDGYFPRESCSPALPERTRSRSDLPESGRRNTRKSAGDPARLCSRVPGCTPRTALPEHPVRKRRRDPGTEAGTWLSEAGRKRSGRAGIRFDGRGNRSRWDSRPRG